MGYPIIPDGATLADGKARPGLNSEVEFAGMRPQRWTPTGWDWVAFSGLAVFLVSLRLFLVITNQWSGEGDLDEALISGRAAFDVLNETWRGRIAYLYITGGHLGNEVGASVLALPLFWLMGPSLLALLTPPTFAAVATAFLIFRLSRSREAAFIATAYLVFMPIAVQTWQIYPYFSHAEAATWLLLALWLLEPIFAGESSGPARPFAAGLAVGLGITLCDVVIAAVPAIAAAWWLSKRAVPPRSAWMPAVLGVLVGTLPFMAYAVVTPSSLAWFYQNLSEQGGPPTDPVAYLSPLALPASMLWPFANLSSNFWFRLLIGLGAIAGLFVWGYRLMRVRRHAIVELAVLGFIAIFIVMNVLMRNTAQYYAYALAAPLAFAVGSVLGEFVGRLKSSNRRHLAVGAVAGLGFMLVVPGLINVPLGDIERGWQTTRIARGYSFYTPGNYKVFSGYKTPLGREVERVLSQTEFQSPGQPTAQDKTIPRTNGSSWRHPLTRPEHYYLYGADVLERGVVRLAAQAANEVEPRYWREAFGGIAVLTVNDFLLGDLLTMFADGVIDRAVPDCCVGMFYSELGRKIRDHEAQDDAAVKAVLAGLPQAMRAQVQYGLTESQYVDYHLPFWPTPR